MAAGRLENVTQTIAKILQGYDIRLRPNFGGKLMYANIFVKCLNKKIRTKKVRCDVFVPNHFQFFFLL